MPFVTLGTENSADIEIHYRDHGPGKPILLIPRAPARRRLLGASGMGAAPGGLPLHQLRPPWLRKVGQPTA